MSRKSSKKGGKPYDASNPEDVRNAEVQEADRDNDLLHVMSDQRGRRWVYDLIYGMEHCHMEANSFSLASDRTIDFNEGARQVGVKVKQDILDKCGAPTYLTMLKENLTDG